MPNLLCEQPSLNRNSMDLVLRNNQFRRRSESRADKKKFSWTAFIRQADFVLSEILSSKIASLMEKPK